MGDGWRSDFGPTHFDFYSPPDFRVQVIFFINIHSLIFDNVVGAISFYLTFFHLTVKIVGTTQSTYSQKYTLIHWW